MSPTGKSPTGKSPTGYDEVLPVTAAVLAGGRSERMGADKILLPVDGESLIARVVDVAGKVCESTIVVTNAPEVLDGAGLSEDVRIVQDEVRHQGPLGGLITALANAEHEWVLMLAADMPWLRPEVIRTLWSVRGNAKVVLPVTVNGAEPLLAFYHVDCLPAAREAMESGRRRLVAFFPKVEVAEVSMATLREVDPDLTSLVNVNTPEDLLRVRESVPSHDETVRPSVIEATGDSLRRLPSELPVTIHMNDVEVATVQASPADLEELAVGFLVAEGLLCERDALERVTADTEQGLVWVDSAESVPDDLAYRKRYITSGCGKGVTFSSMGHAKDLRRVDSQMEIDSATLYDMMGQLARGAVAYRETGGMHACGLGTAGAVTLIREDVGRHNALDKVLGRAWLDAVPTADAVLLSTGRISYEMAIKAAKAKVPIVASRTAVTDLAVDVAESVGITLVGYARGGRMVVYAHPERVRMEEASG